MPHLIKWMRKSSYPCLTGPDKGKKPHLRAWEVPNFCEINRGFSFPDHQERNKDLSIYKQMTVTDSRNNNGRNLQNRIRSIDGHNLRRRGGYFEDGDPKPNHDSDGFLFESSQRLNVMITPSPGMNQHQIDPSLQMELHDPLSKREWQSMWNCTSTLNSDKDQKDKKNQQITKYGLNSFHFRPMKTELQRIQIVNEAPTSGFKKVDHKSFK